MLEDLTKNILSSASTISDSITDSENYLAGLENLMDIDKA